jgi:hypothetical protein
MAFEITALPPLIAVLVTAGLLTDTPPRASRPVARRVVYRAPGERTRAVVTYYRPNRFGTRGSRVEIEDSRGRPIAAQDYSGGGTQGYEVTRAAWTRTARFFVFSVESAGGHQPWHFPTHFFDRRVGQFGLLDALVVGPGVSDPNFRLRKDNEVTVKPLDRPSITFDLGRLTETQSRMVHRAEKEGQRVLHGSAHP